MAAQVEQNVETVKGDDNYPVAPARDFQRVPNSITRGAMPSGLFRGKSKQVWDYLWSQSRGARDPTRKVRRSRPQVKRGAGLGSLNTVDSCLAHLEGVGLLRSRKVRGEKEGNEYEVLTPEEMGADPHSTLTGSTGTTSRISDLTTQKLVLPVLPESGSTTSSLSTTPSSTSERRKTSFKTNKEIDDDEAFAGMNAVLRRAAAEVTGGRMSPAEGERWTALGELLAAELKITAARTTVSSAPAFLTAHLSRRLLKAVAFQAGRAVAGEQLREAGEPRRSAKPDLTADQIQAAVNQMVELMGRGRMIESLDEEFADRHRLPQWQMIRSMALVQAKLARAGDTERADVHEPLALSEA
jgi:hypothetical protein